MIKPKPAAAPQPDAAPAAAPPAGMYRPLPPYSGLAIAAMVCGICSLWTFGVSGIVALFLAYNARRQIRDAAGALRGDGMAITGLVFGWISAVGWALMIGVITLGVIGAIVAGPGG